MQIESIEAVVPQDLLERLQSVSTRLLLSNSYKSTHIELLRSSIAKLQLTSTITAFKSLSCSILRLLREQLGVGEIVKLRTEIPYLFPSRIHDFSPSSAYSRYYNSSIIDLCVVEEYNNLEVEDLREKCASLFPLTGMLCFIDINLVFAYRPL